MISLLRERSGYITSLCLHWQRSPLLKDVDIFAVWCINSIACCVARRRRLSGFNDYALCCGHRVLYFLLPAMSFSTSMTFASTCSLDIHSLPSRPLQCSDTRLHPPTCGCVKPNSGHRLPTSTNSFRGLRTSPDWRRHLSSRASRRQREDGLGRRGRL